MTASRVAPPAPDELPPVPAATTDTDFPTVWSDPADAGLTWEQDDMHMPSCLTPLAWDYAILIGRSSAYRFARMGVDIEFRAQVFNGYAYFVWRPLGPESEHAAIRERYTEAKREHAPLASAYWRRAVGELLELYGWIRDVPVDDLPAEDLAVAWKGAWDRALRAWQIHFYAIVGPYQVLDDLADVYESVVENTPPGEALRLIQGRVDELVAVDAGLGRLTDLVAAAPAVAAAIEANPAPSPEDLGDLPGGATFAAELRRFLDQHGHLGQGFDDLALASWAEEPAMLLAEIAKRLEHPIEPAVDRAARLGREADELADAFCARLADQPEKLAEFERLLALARQIGRITETHNYWIDRMAQARLRSFVMRVGARLAREGAIERREDVLYLRRAEIPDLLRSPADRRSLVAQRRADHEHWRTVKPPASVGKPPTKGPSGRFDGERFATEDEATVRGTGASAGIVSGPARIVLGPADFARVGPGDIVVAPSSNPSWVPLFAIAGGLITNTGGVLSHAAVVAREFDLPAVVGTGDATTRIADGRTVELDGTTGLVRLL